MKKICLFRLYVFLVCAEWFNDLSDPLSPLSVTQHYLLEKQAIYAINLHNGSISKKKYKFPTAVLLFTTVFLPSCGHLSDKGGDTIHLDNIVKIENTDLAESTIAPGCYWQMDIVGDSILVLNDRCNVEQQFFHFYRLPDYHPVLSFGRIGQGPNEFGSMPFLVKSDSSHFFISEPHGVLKEFVWQENGLNEVKQMALFNPGARDISLEGAMAYGKNTTEGNGMIFSQPIYESGGAVNWIGIPESIELSPLEKDNAQLLGDNSFAVNHEKRRIVSGMRHFNRVYVFDLDGTVIREIHIGLMSKKTDLIDPKSNFIAEEAPIYINGVASTDDYVYFIYYGKTFTEMDTAEGSGSSMILVFDWDGNHQKTLGIDGRIEAIAVSNDNHSVFLGRKDGADGLNRLLKYTVNK